MNLFLLSLHFKCSFSHSVCLFHLNWPIRRETHLNHVSVFVAFLEFNDNSPDRWMETERGGEYILKGRH